MRDQLKLLTPRLRRYARALVTGSPGSAEIADDLVQATLMRALGSRHLDAGADLAIRLFATVTQLHREVAVSGQQARMAGSGRPSLVVNEAYSAAVRQTKLSAALMSLPLEDREALLLVALEGFDHGEAARILRISRSSLLARLTQARTALETSLQSRPAVPSSGRVSYLRLVT